MQQQPMPQHMHPQFAGPGMQHGAVPAMYPPAAQNAALSEQLRQFWAGQLLEVQQAGIDPAEFKNTQLPLARIKKVGDGGHAVGA